MYVNTSLGGGRKAVFCPPHIREREGEGGGLNKGGGGGGAF